MATLSISTALQKLTLFPSSSSSSSKKQNLPFLSFPISIQNPNSIRFPIRHAATKSQTGPVKKRSSSSSTASSNTNKKKKRRTKSSAGDNLNLRDVEIVKDDGGLADVQVVVDDDSDDDFDSDSDSGLGSRKVSTHPTTPLPKPPAGFVVDDSGRVLLASTKRIVTMADPINNYLLECVIRRIFRSSRGDECMLLCPADTPVQILKSVNIDGWSAVSDEEVESILPAAAYALAKIHMHLVHSGFCYTARGGFCYSEDDIFDFRTDDGEDIDGLPNEANYSLAISSEIVFYCLPHLGVYSVSLKFDATYWGFAVMISKNHMPELGNPNSLFYLADGAHYMIYTPSDPLLFVAVKDKDGQLQIADDDLLEDPAIISAIDEETEFNALVEEEAALLESLMGER
ncbi:unnamed protein product [Dovyalis caffra]|uniref:BTB/POZ domain-containing protein TNFAIP1 n=1 Tax=Dovyalis caffra TaxID=77055 RepID=A0AAV1SQF1_9ROSI|nr:unnamed protein product [Dovyalis caffra]